MASLRWIAGFACLLSILALAIAEQQGQPSDSPNDTSESSATTAPESLPLMSTSSGSTRVVSLKIYEKSDAGNRVIGCPSVQFLPGQSFSVLAGTTSSSGDLEAGYSIQGNSGQCVDGEMPLSLSITLGESNHQQSSVQQAQSQSLQFNFDITVPGTKTVKLSADCECEVIVR